MKFSEWWVACMWGRYSPSWNGLYALYWFGQGGKLWKLYWALKSWRLAISDFKYGKFQDNGIVNPHA